jgi:hypothetical protein
VYRYPFLGPSSDDDDDDDADILGIESTVDTRRGSRGRGACSSWGLADPQRAKGGEGLSRQVGRACLHKDVRAVL